MMSIIQALLFMALGGAIVEIFEIHAWRRYNQGKQEGLEHSNEPSRRSRI